MRLNVPLGFSVGLVRWTEAAREVLRALESARGGNAITRLLAIGTVAGSLAEVAFPRWGVGTTLAQYGYEQVGGGVWNLLSDLLRNSHLRPHSIPAGEAGVTIELWTPDGCKDPQIATVSSRRDPGGDSLFLQKEYDVGPLFQALAWSKGISLMVSVQTKGIGGPQYSIRPMGPPGQFVGSPSPQDVAQRLMRARSETRSLLLVGPSGSGKSTMARIIAHEIAGKDARTLKIAGSVLKQCPFEVVLDLAKYLRPTVLLLDDVPLTSTAHMDELLSLFEALQGHTKLVISTYMDDSPHNDSDGDGSNYWPGMRPGRIDEVQRTKRPSLQNRCLILERYFVELGVVDVPVRDIAVACEGLTGAYLKEVARRIAWYGSADWQSEVQAVRRAAPLKQRGREEDWGGDDTSDAVSKTSAYDIPPPPRRK